MKKVLFIKTLLLLIVNSGNSQNLQLDTIKVYSANVYKQDKSFIDVGILWETKDDELLLLPKSQFRKLKNAEINQTELRFTRIRADNLKYLKLSRGDKKRKSFLIGLGVGVAIGIPIGIVRQSKYDKEYCENGDDPLWIKCIGGRNRLANNIAIWGIVGGFAGLIEGSVKIKIDLRNGKESYLTQKEKIKKYTIMK